MSSSRNIDDHAIRELIALIVCIAIVVIIANFPSLKPTSFDYDIDMKHHYILYSDFCHWVHFTMVAGKKEVTINMIPADVLMKDRHYHRITFAVNIAPGGGKSCNATLSDGTSTMIVTLSGAETSGWTIVNEFDLDVSVETLTLNYGQDAGGSATKGFMTIKYHYMETP